MAQIAGQFITSVGGLVGFCPFGGSIGANGNRTVEFTPSATCAPPSTTSANYFDAADWNVTINAFFDDVTNTGSYGAQSIERTCEGFSAEINVITDIRYPPDMLAKYGYPFVSGTPVPLATAPYPSNYAFNLGCRMTLIEGSGYNYPVDGQALNFWYCPSVKISSATPIIDANNKKMVRMSIKVEGNARIFKLPAEFNALNDYITHLANRGQVF